MAMGEVVAVLWHRHGNFLNVIYGQGVREHLVGDEGMAAKLAEDAGLEPVPTADGTLRWARR